MIATRHRDDVHDIPGELPGLTIRVEERAHVMAALQGREEMEMHRRMREGHRAYVASLNGVDAAFGWVATVRATIGEIHSDFDIPEGERYLWNFVTLPAFRGKGIYPRLIEGIVRQEAREAERFWVAYAPENFASGAGIERAGFRTVAQISFDQQDRPAVRMLVEGAPNPAQMLGLRTIEEPLAQCWRCVRMGRTKERSCEPGECRCDYQRPQSGCAEKAGANTAAA